MSIERIELRKKYYDGKMVREAVMSVTDDYNTIMKLLQAFADQPPLPDAVEVVRCKDCKWYKTMYCKMDRWTDLVTVYMAKADDYCSYGEKWEGAKMYERWKDE